MNYEEPPNPPKHLRLLIAAIVVILILIAFCLSWLTMPRPRGGTPPQTPHAAPSAK